MSPLLYIASKPGEILGDRYELLEELGHGSFGVVWKARRLSDDQLVAIKIPRDQELGEEVLRQETELVKEFNHPNIVRIFDVLTLGGLFIIEMELVDGYSLAQLLDGVGPQRPLSFSQILLWAQQILHGLYVLHSDSVVHGDIKPQNILINQSGLAKLADFGTSRRIVDVWMWTRRQGTEPYWAPEVAFDGRRSLVSDIYSLGVVLYEMVTGQLPYQSPYELLAGRQVRKPREINPDIPAQLERIIMQAMQRDPEDRYPSVKAMLVEIDQAVSELQASLLSRQKERAEPSRVGFRLDSSSPLYYLEQAKQYLAEKNFPAALSAVQVCVERSGGHPNYLRLLAGIQKQLGYLSQTISTYERLLDVYERSFPGRDDQIADALERVGSLYIEAKHYRKAIQAYKRLVELSPGKSYARFKLGVVYGLDGQYKRAIELLEEVRRERPEVAIVYSKLGLAYMGIRNERTALSYYNQALVLDPFELTSLYELARYYWISGDRRSSRVYLQRLREADNMGLYKKQMLELDEE